MKLMYGDMMSVLEKVDHFLICTDSNVKNGQLYMPNGVAAKIAALDPSIKFAVGKWITENHGDNCPVYGIRVVGKVGLFQSMLLLREGPNMAVVSFSAGQLKALAEANPDKTYALEAPNYIHGWWLVEGMLKDLPENVQVWLPEN